jgi:hypothetical protein
MPDQTTPVESRPNLQEELDRANEEILRLRDLLISKDAELGTALGRQLQLETQSRHLLGLMARVSRVPGAMRLGGAALRRLRGRRGQAGD